MAQVYDWSLGTGVSESDLADFDAMVSDQMGAIYNTFRACKRCHFCHLPRIILS
jgi:hypothetical protein